ncbi:uncharacterized protein L201_006921 [Kwoniella dendrophila CBS 6074]|uniref:Uncharacterized protein n=1 Tax=Kwoniella dendrophila CBS 6074 TaxID=1295534 RepID=A0AAX4K4E6_9TREE
MSPSPIQPLFTTSPLILPPNPTTSHQPLIFTSPKSTSPSKDKYHDDEEEEELVKHIGFTSSQPSSAYPSVPPSPVFEALSFAKIPLPSSATVSTDSEAFSSDCAAGLSRSNSQQQIGNYNGNGIESKRSSIQSPSLISCLFQSTSIVNSSNNINRKSSCPPSTATNNHRSGSINAVGSGSRPILRRDTISTSASEDNKDHFSSIGFGLGINKLPLEIDTNVSRGVPPPLKKKPSVLKFAVTSPRNNAPSQSRSRSTSTSISPTSSYANVSNKFAKSPCIKPDWSKVRGQVERETRQIEEENDDEDGNDDFTEEDDDDEEGYMVESPLPIPGHDDEDLGYVEDDEEDDDDEDEDDDINHGADRLFGNTNINHTASGSNWRNNELHWNRDFPVVTTPKRRSTTIIPSTSTNYMTSTDDNSVFPNILQRHVSSPNMPGSGRGRKTSICINENTKPSSSRCTRHRSPPPPIRSQSNIFVPPAARSPSAAELCKRRGSASNSAEGLFTNTLLGNSKKGWKSDDSAFFTNRPTINQTTSIKLPSANKPVMVGIRKNSLPTPNLGTRSRSTSTNSSTTRSILKSSTSSHVEDKPTSIPMIRSSGENKIPPKTPPLDNLEHPQMVYPNSVNLLRRGSEPVRSIQDKQNDLSVDIVDDLNLNMNNSNGCLARSAIGYEEEEMNIAHIHGHHGQNHYPHHHHIQNPRGIRII